MTANSWGGIYQKLGVRPMINATGNLTARGGSTPSSAVRKAMQEADSSYVEMSELLEKAGQYVATQLGVEAAYPTAGCYAALVLCSATVMTGNDPDKRSQLPDTTGLKHEIILQKIQRYGYDRAYTIPGSKLTIVGNDDGCTEEQLERAIGPDTAAIAYLIQPNQGNAIPLEIVVEMAHAHDIPVIADAAAQIHPLDYFRRNAQSADLVCFGGKYFNAPHSTGLACGRKDLIQAVIAHGFIGPRPIGRGMKVDRQEIIGLVTAIDIWMNTDHQERLRNQNKRYAVISEHLKSLDQVSTEIVCHKRHTLSDLHVTFDPETLGKNARQITNALDAGSPRVCVEVDSDNTITINAYTLNQGEELLIAQALREQLSNANSEIMIAPALT